jgi:hypothetical protein
MRAAAGKLSLRRRPPFWLAWRLVAACAALGACSGGATGRAPASHARAATPPPVAAPTTTLVAQPAPDPEGTAWLCRPGSAPDPCTSSLAATTVTARGVRRITEPADDSRSGFDCFYVYPTVSTETGENANLEVQRAEIDTAELQAAYFSTLCRVWAPMYRQVTVGGLFDPTKSASGLATAYQSLLSAWRDYLANDNAGRPVIFIGHSQGSSMLIRLIETQIDPVPAMRARTVLAILAGGNVVTPPGRPVGGSFAHLPLCTRAGQAGCVIAYSTFPGPPPPGSLFGRPGEGVSLLAGQTRTSGLQVACTNPASLGGGSADLDSIFPSVEFPPRPAAGTPWVVYPDLYSSTCRQAGGATWLQVNIVDADGRPTVGETLGPEWGYHLYDVNLTLGNLLADAAAAEHTWTAGS